MSIAHKLTYVTQQQISDEDCEFFVMTGLKIIVGQFQVVRRRLRWSRILRFSTETSDVLEEPIPLKIPQQQLCRLQNTQQLQLSSRTLISHRSSQVFSLHFLCSSRPVCFADVHFLQHSPFPLCNVQVGHHMATSVVWKSWLFPRELSSLWQGTEYLVKQLQRSCAKLKICTRPVPCTNDKSYEYNNPTE